MRRPGSYSDVHFAATLLECGPHVTEDHCEGWFGLPGDSIHDYRDRVYNHFFKLFPSFNDVPLGVRTDAAHEWSIFWREYREWVEGGDPWLGSVRRASNAAYD